MAEQNETLKAPKQTEPQQNPKDNTLDPVSDPTIQTSSVGNGTLASSHPSTCTPLTTVNSTTTITDNSAAGLLFFLNSAYTNQVTATTNSVPSTTYGNAVLVPHTVNISLLSQVQNVMSTVNKPGNNSGNNVIETAMDLANLGDVSEGDSAQHPITNAALTLVSLGSTVGQPVQEIVIDESGRSSFAHDSNLGEVSVTVESEGTTAVSTSKSQSDISGLYTAAMGSLCDDSDKVSPASKNDKVIREVVTQTGGGSGEVVILKSSRKAKQKSVSALLTEQSMERKRIAEIREAQRNLVIDKERPFSCEKCDKKFLTKHDVKRHMVVHSDVKPFGCETCDKTFRTSNELNLHIPVHNKDTPYKCEFCSKEFRTKGCFKSHIKYHIGDKRHKCDICGRAFVKSADLKRHVAGHKNEKNFKCEECGSAFTRRDNLKAHMLLHSREKVVTCDKCNKEFINSIYLKRHMHIHKQAKKKPYECQWCPKTYEQLEGLRRHIRQHVGDEKFVCEQCAKKFITAIQLKRHLWLSHEQNSPYQRSIL